MLEIFVMCCSVIRTYQRQSINDVGQGVTHSHNPHSSYFPLPVHGGANQLKPNIYYDYYIYHLSIHIQGVLEVPPEL